jgi:hypothetical protein
VHLRLGSRRLLRALVVPLVVTGTVSAAGMVGPAAMAAPAPPAAACGHKIIQPFALGVPPAGQQASALARLAQRVTCSAAALAGTPILKAPSVKVPSPNAISPRTDTAASNIVDAVDATSTTDAWAVGTTVTSTTASALIEHWDGSTWRAMPSPSPGNLSELFSVTAISATSAWAVGMTQDGTGTLVALTEQWDGTQWSVVPGASLFPNENILVSVSAVSASSVWAVGFTEASGGTLTPLAEHWDGSSWNLSGASAPSSFTELTAVTAISATNVIAVGLFINASGFVQALTERWDGTQWTTVPSPSGANDTELFAVTATSPTSAWAVGLSDDSTGLTQPLIERWNGTVWSVVPNPALSNEFGELRAVTATSTSNAWAVGDFDNANGAEVTVTEHWDGKAWSVVPSANPGVLDQLNGVMATSTSNAWAVGDTQGAFGAEETLTEQLKSSAWKVVPSPNPGTVSRLQSVAATSASNAWAAGFFLTAAGVQQTLAEHWDGTAWTAVPSPNPSATSNELRSVSATSATNAWAVGDFTDGNGIVQPLAEHWDGTAWTAVAVTSPLGRFQELNSVVATSATNAWAAGSFTDSSGTAQTLVEHWDGTSWSIRATPSVAGGVLNGVSATSASNVWAVGGTLAGRPVIEHWNGTAWSVVPTFDPGQLSTLWAVDATSTSNAIAVGSVNNASTGQPTPLSERWDGTGWTILPNPSPNPQPGQQTQLIGVAATSATNAWAAGLTPVFGDTNPRPLIERWDGTAWTTVLSANPLPHAFGDAVAATSGTNAWLVGHYGIDGPVSPPGEGTLIEHWNGTTWATVPSP